MLKNISNSFLRIAYLLDHVAAVSGVESYIGKSNFGECVVDVMSLGHTAKKPIAFLFSDDGKGVFSTTYYPTYGKSVPRWDTQGVFVLVNPISGLISYESSKILAAFSYISPSNSIFACDPTHALAYQYIISNAVMKCKGIKGGNKLLEGDQLTYERLNTALEKVLTDQESELWDKYWRWVVTDYETEVGGEERAARLGQNKRLANLIKGNHYPEVKYLSILEHALRGGNLKAVGSILRVYPEFCVYLNKEITGREGEEGVELPTYKDGIVSWTSLLRARSQASSASIRCR